MKIQYNNGNIFTVNLLPDASPAARELEVQCNRVNVRYKDILKQDTHTVVSVVNGAGRAKLEIFVYTDTLRFDVVAFSTEVSQERVNALLTELCKIPREEELVSLMKRGENLDKIKDTQGERPTTAVTGGSAAIEPGRAGGTCCSIS